METSYSQRLLDLYAACHAVFLTFDHPNWRGDDETIEPIRDLMNLVPFDQQTKEEQQAAQLSRRTRLVDAEERLAKVRERAIQARQVGLLIMMGCLLCDCVWKGDEPERHAEDCPARPMEPGT